MAREAGVGGFNPVGLADAKERLDTPAFRPSCFQQPQSGEQKMAKAGEFVLLSMVLLGGAAQLATLFLQV